LIRAFVNANLDKNIKLVLAGDADHETTYSLDLKKQAKEAGIILTGFVKGNVLEQLFSNCGLFVIPSFYEGLPIALLEAMAYKLPIIASDIRANTQVELDETAYFKVGSENELTNKLNAFLKTK
jgi:glycosyltransferase involved in cell wall biosynthesis